MTSLALGTRLWISARPFVLGSVCEFVEVCNVASIGGISESSQDRSAVEVDHQMDTARTRHFKGEISTESIQVVCNYSADDDGQIAAYRAFKNEGDEFAFKLMRPVGPVIFAIGTVMTHSGGGMDGPNSVLTRQFTIAPNDIWEAE